MTVSFDPSFTLGGVPPVWLLLSLTLYLSLHLTMKSILQCFSAVHSRLEAESTTAQLKSKCQMCRSQTEICLGSEQTPLDLCNQLEDNWWPQAINLQLQVSCKKCALAYHSVLTQRKGLDSLWVTNTISWSAEGSWEISPKLPDEITKCLEDSKQWLQVCYHSQCLCKWWYTKNGKSSLTGCGEERNPSFETSIPDDLLQWDSNNPGKSRCRELWGTTKEIEIKPEKGTLVLEYQWLPEEMYWNNCPGTTTLGDLLIQTSPSSYLPSTSHSAFTFLFRVRACWGLGFLLLWFCLHLKDWCVWLVVAFFNQDSYCIVNSQWTYYLDVAVSGTFQAGVLYWA